MRLLTAVLILTVGCGSEPREATNVTARTNVTREMERRVRRELRDTGSAQVLINLALARGESIRAAQQRVIRAAGEDLRVLYIFDSVPALAGVLSPRGLERLLAEPLVASVQVDEPGRGHLAQCVPVVKADTVHAAYGWTGKKVRVAVIDSGIDTDHPDLMDDLVAQQCFSGDCPPGKTTSGPSAEDDFGHGTAVSGIITSKGTVSAVGVAPDAEIVAVRVLDANNAGGPSKWIAGLDWVLTNLATLKVQVVNLSLGSWTQYPGNCDAQQPALADVIKKLIAKGVVVFASAGNKGSSAGIDAPACISGVIAVGATYDSDMGRQPPTGAYPTGCFDATTGPGVIGCFTNSGSELDLVTPGVSITSTYVGGKTITWTGTSLSAPVAAASGALLLDCKPTLTPAQVETALEQSGSKITDPKNSLAFPSVDVLAAVNKTCTCAGKPDGAACQDGKLCTTDACKAGLCVGTPVVCKALDQCHVAGTCNPSTGVCSSPLKPVGSTCDDGKACTKGDACTAAGACTGAAYSCTPNQCQANSKCDGKGGCTPTFKPSGAVCDDGAPCTKKDVCDGKGGCAGTAYTCTPTQCEASSTCDGKGGCTPTPRADGTPCDDGDTCTQTDTCQSGGCSGGDPVACPAPAECHEQGTCDPKTGACSDPLSPDGTACSGGGSCAAGVCVPPPDIGVPDLATPDSGAPDVGAPDSRVHEGGAQADATGGDPGSQTSNGCSCSLEGPGAAPSILPLSLLVLLGLRLRRRA
jgi:MYXO-CTERM domain-containing protein